MALAILKYDGTDRSNHLFSADIGDNNYFRIYIGGFQTYRKFGVALLSNRNIVSKLYGPLPEAKFGRINFRIPDQLITRDNSSIQLISYRDNQQNGMAISSIKRVIPRIQGVELPHIQLSMKTTTNIEQEIENIPFQFKEQPVSTGMFLGNLFKMLPKAIPVVGEVIGGLTGGGSSSESGSSEGGGGNRGGIMKMILDLLKDPEQLQKILRLVTCTWRIVALFRYDNKPENELE